MLKNTPPTRGGVQDEAAEPDVFAAQEWRRREQEVGADRVACVLERRAIVAPCGKSRVSMS